LHLAASDDQEETAELLLTERAQVNARDALGSTPLNLADQKANKNMVDLLRRNGGH
jgi:ankyrin repeat protein